MYNLELSCWAWFDEDASIKFGKTFHLYERKKWIISEFVFLFGICIFLKPKINYSVVCKKDLLGRSVETGLLKFSLFANGIDWHK